MLLLPPQPAMRKEMTDKEAELTLSQQEYDALKQQLHHMMTTIAKEAADIENLEAELREG